MKLMIISDIHGSLSALTKVNTLFNNGGYDLLVCCGDYLNHGPRNPLPNGYDTQGTAALLNTLAPTMVGVRGNCDSEVDQMMLTFPCLAESTLITETTPRGLLKIFVHHGHQTHAVTAGSRVILSGHTHIPALTIGNDVILCNPGSISLPKNNSVPSYAELITDTEGNVTITIRELDTPNNVVASCQW